MKNSIFLNFLFLLLSKHKSKHLAIFFISIIIVFLISSVMFISNSLKKEIFTTLNSQADFVIQKLNAGKVVNLPTSWLDKFSSINGVTKVQQRVYGQYHFKFADVNFMIVGIDLFEKTQIKIYKNF